ncbi:hypothetical protein [Christiangramia sabulilitoris]|uniref:Uncharacterized protein n=1 Tax=Christiangramia sabulilitoris TaxID=2583991 RepID=A0A550I754_9FLAO|nr:hypothetical protein [Christiangramia sabulilitoris]TRO66800.1 hypothetical protein FGM01_02600 [Christiangramia sabulilitoris]
MKILTVITFCLIVVTSSAQDLKGKWFLTKEGDTYIVPENLIMEVKKDSIKYYSFDQFVFTQSAKIEEKKIKFENGDIRDFEFINQNSFKFISQKDKDSTNFEYVRLIPTKTNLQKEEIENLSFEFNWNGEKIKIKFKQEKGFEEISLEKIDSTYFASFYLLGKRAEVLPIKEITLDKMILYGTPGKPYEIVGEKIE